MSFLLVLKRLLMIKCCFTSTETVGLLGTGAQDVHLDFHTLLSSVIKIKIIYRAGLL